MSLHPAVEERLGRLAPDQRAAATAPPGPLLCVAPAGSGKTTTLVARICWLVASGGDPALITAVTFNKRAADELDDRLKAALAPLGLAADPPRVKTFHALGREILADAGVSVANLADRTDVLRSVFRHTVSAATMRRFDDGFSRLKLDLGLGVGDVVRLLGTPDALPVTPQIARAYVAYERWLVEHDALDFDDLVRRSLAALRADDSLRRRWQERCSTLLVDEVQDVDRSQLDLALLLAGERRDIFLVGDDDQTIYAWRLADVRRVLDLAASLPGLRRVDLETNYRCPRPVVERAVRLVAGNRERFVKEIRAGPGAGGSLVLGADSGDELARARRLLTTWLSLESGVHAVLARTNAELAPYAAVALELGIPYRAAEDGLLLDDPRIDEILARLGTGRPAVELARCHPTDPVARNLVPWAVSTATVDDLRDAIGTARSRRNELGRDDAELVLATAHGTKGLEFDHVAVIGLDDGVFPSRRTLEESDDPLRALEEERRLAYVAWTRAKRSLLLVYDPAAPSVFMREAFSDMELEMLPALSARRAA